MQIFKLLKFVLSYRSDRRMRIKVSRAPDRYKKLRLWAKGHALQADVNGSLFNVFAKKEAQFPDEVFKYLYRNAHGVVWLRQTTKHKFSVSNNTTQLSQFARLILPHLEQPITLITSEGASDVPDDIDDELFKTIIESPLIKRWYTQNLCTSAISEKLQPIPLGLNLNTNRGCGTGTDFAHRLLKLRAVADASKNERRNQIFVDCLTHATHPGRADLAQLIGDNPIFEVASGYIQQAELLEKYSQYRFVLSIRGLGRDCYRTWEALMMGAIPVIIGEDNFGLLGDMPALKLPDQDALLALTQDDLERCTIENNLDPKELLSRNWF